MKKYWRFWCLFLVLIGAALLSAGCGTGSQSNSGGSNYNEKSTEAAVADSANEIFSGSHAAETEKVTENRKIIEKLYFSLQTKEFDSLIQNIEAKAAEAGGYVESSSIDGKELEYDNHRNAEMVIRIPAEKSDAFSAYISENSTVINKEVTTEDVTLSYVDIESRISALNTEKASLENLLANAQNISDIITIQEKLTDVIYEIESYQSQLRTYDNLVDYTTITISVSEVERTQVVKKQTIWEEIGTNLGNNMHFIGNFFVRLFVVIASSLPFLLILVVIVIVIVVLVKRSDKKGQKKRAGEQQMVYNPYGRASDNNSSMPSEQPEKAEGEDKL